MFSYVPFFTIILLLISIISALEMRVRAKVRSGGKGISRFSQWWFGIAYRLESCVVILYVFRNSSSSSFFECITFLSLMVFRCTSNAEIFDFRGENSLEMVAFKRAGKFHSSISFFL